MSLQVRQAVTPDLSYVMSLMRANRESVGGLPEPAIMERIDRGTVLLASINDDPVGYVLYDVRGRVLRIPQACIQYDARRRKYGEALVVRLLELHAQDIGEIALRCAADLEANVFWRDMGFTCVGTLAGGRRRGRTINVWTMWLEPRLLSPSDIAVLPAAELRQDSMYDDSGFLTDSPNGFRTAVVLPKLAWSNRKARPHTGGHSVKGRCQAVAEQRGTHESIRCILSSDHKHSHYWERVVGDQLRSCSWYGPDDGLPTLVGPDANADTRSE